MDHRGHARRRRREDHAVTSPADPEAKRVRGLRANSFAAIVILLIEYGLGMWINLYGHLPSSGRGAGLAGGFARAVADGPVGLSIHALLGLLLIASASTALVRSILVRRPALTALTAIALAAIVSAGISGARFVGRDDNGSSMSMAVAAGVAIAVYALTLFRSATSLSKKLPRTSMTAPFILPEAAGDSRRSRCWGGKPSRKTRPLTPLVRPPDSVPDRRVPVPYPRRRPTLRMNSLCSCKVWTRKRSKSVSRRTSAWSPNGSSWKWRNAFPFR